MTQDSCESERETSRIFSLCDGQRTKRQAEGGRGHWDKSAKREVEKWWTESRRSVWKSKEVKEQGWVSHALEQTICTLLAAQQSAFDFHVPVSSSVYISVCVLLGPHI